MKLFTVIIGNLLFALSVFSQTSNKSISGQVVDIQHIPAAGATLHLQKASDSIVMQSVTARDNGRFSFTNLQTGSFIVTITYAGSKKYLTNGLTIDEQHPSIVLPIIILTPNKQTDLKEVVVATKKPLIEQDIDKTVVNVEAMISSATSNAMEVLEKTPGITVSKDGDISLNGNQGALVLIEGRPTYMSATDLAAYLRSIPGSTLDKIELMSNPPAKYDAAGSAVINIRLKRNRTQGYTGSVSTSFSQGKTNSNYNSINLNHLDKKINLFGSVSFNNDNNFDDDRYNRIFYNSTNEKTVSTKLDNYYSYHVNDFTARIGMDYTLSPKTTIGLIASTYTSNKKDNMDSYNNSYRFNNNLPDSSGYGNTKRTATWKQVTANINLQHKFNNNGKELSADVNYVQYNNKANRLLNNFVYTDNGSLDSNYLFRYYLPSGIDIFTFKADYTHPLQNKIILSAGIKSSVVKNDNESAYSDIISNSYKPDPSKSNHFIYDENINAAYINARKEWKRFGIQAGLRLENTNIKGNQLGNEVVPADINTRHYTKLFPSLFLNYKLDSNGKNTLSFNFSRRINRPGYQQLNPFILFIDQYTYSTGNPLLDASYNNNIEASYRYKQLLTITYQYGRISNAFFNATQTVNNIFITKPENTDARYMMAVLVNLNLSPAKWWRFNLNMGGANFGIKGMVYNQSLDESRYAYRFNLLNQFNFSNNWSAEIAGRYNSSIVQLQQTIGPRYQLNAGVQKKILKGKGSLKLTVDDIFYTLKQKVHTTGLLLADAYQVNIQDSRRISIGINLNFGKETFARKRKYSDNTSDDVKERVN